MRVYHLLAIFLAMLLNSSTDAADGSCQDAQSVGSIGNERDPVDLVTTGSIGQPSDYDVPISSCSHSKTSTGQWFYFDLSIPEFESYTIELCVDSGPCGNSLRFELYRGHPTTCQSTDLNCVFESTSGVTDSYTCDTGTYVSNRSPSVRSRVSFRAAPSTGMIYVKALSPSCVSTPFYLTFMPFRQSTPSVWWPSPPPPPPTPPPTIMVPIRPPSSQSVLDGDTQGLIRLVADNDTRGFPELHFSCRAGYGCPTLEATDIIVHPFEGACRIKQHKEYEWYSAVCQGDFIDVLIGCTDGLYVELSWTTGNYLVVTPGRYIFQRPATATGYFFANQFQVPHLFFPNDTTCIRPIDNAWLFTPACCENAANRTFDQCKDWKRMCDPPFVESEVEGSKRVPGVYPALAMYEPDSDRVERILAYSLVAALAVSLVVAAFASDYLWGPVELRFTGMSYWRRIVVPLMILGVAGISSYGLFVLSPEAYQVTFESTTGLTCQYKELYVLDGLDCDACCSSPQAADNSTLRMETMTRLERDIMRQRVHGNETGEIRYSQRLGYNFISCQYQCERNAIGNVQDITIYPDSRPSWPLYAIPTMLASVTWIVFRNYYGSVTKPWFNNFLMGTTFGTASSTILGGMLETKSLQTTVGLVPGRNHPIIHPNGIRWVYAIGPFLVLITTLTEYWAIHTGLANCIPRVQAGSAESLGWFGFSSLNVCPKVGFTFVACCMVSLGTIHVWFFDSPDVTGNPGTFGGVFLLCISGCVAALVVAVTIGCKNKRAVTATGELLYAGGWFRAWWTMTALIVDAQQLYIAFRRQQEWWNISVWFVYGAYVILSSLVDVFRRDVAARAI